MSLGIEIHEWRKQLVEKLLLQGVGIEELEKKMNAAEMVIYGNQIATVTIECPFKFAGELKAILQDFSKKNGCYVIARTAG